MGYRTASIRSRQSRPRYAYVPRTVDFAAAGIRPDWREYAAYVVSLVVFPRFLRRDKTDKDWQPLAEKFVRRFVPDRVRRPLFNSILAAGILECDGEYHFGGFGGKALRYRLGPSYRGVEIVRILVTKPALLKKLIAEDLRYYDTVQNPVHIALQKWHERATTVPDAPYGLNDSLDFVIDGERRCAVCPQGRFHTEIGNLPKEYRQYVRLDGERLWSVDVSASQPLLLGCLLAGYVENPEKTHPLFGLLPSRKLNPPGRPPLYARFSLGCPISGAAEFVSDCVSGGLYARLHNGVPEYTRDEVKARFMAVMYGDPAHSGTRVGRALREIHPTIYKAIRTLNMPVHLGGSGLARLLQRLESDVMILGAAGRLIRGDRKMPLLTLHDSILVAERYVETVTEAIRAEWKVALEVEPHLKTKPW